MVLEPSEVSVCLQHPGFDVDLEVTVDTARLYRVYLERVELGDAKTVATAPRRLHLSPRRAKSKLVDGRR